MTTERELTFPPYRLDLGDERLWRGRHALPLTPRAFAVLRHLVEHRGRLVTRDDLLRAIWGEVHVGAPVVKGCIREIRRALGDPARAPSFIETVHRRGYRFIAEIPTTETPTALLRDEPPAPLASTEARTPSRRVPLVGRDRELARLRASLDRALQGERQVVLVTGEPGIGKTTLVEAFVREMVVGANLWMAWGQCVEQARSAEAYLPVLDALGRLCRGSGRERLGGVLRRYAPTWLAQMPSLIDPTDRESLRREILGATPERMLREMAEALEALTTEAPLVLALEDLQWSDDGTVDLLAALARRRGPARLLIVGTFRDTEITAPPHPLTTAMHEMHMHRLCEEIRLDLLDETAVRAYLAARFPGHRFPAALAHIIHARTDGNALFMTDVIDDLVRQGSLAPVGSRWELQSAIEEVAPGVPPSLRHMVERQLDRLSSDEQRLLEAASAAGTEFSSREVAPALDARAEQVEAWSEGLARRHQLLQVAGVEQGPGAVVNARYGFIHSLYRHAIDARLTGARRARLNQRIGEAKEALRGDRAAAIAPELAAHFEHAGDHRRALHYFGVAAEKTGPANRAAIAYLSRALSLVERGGDDERAVQRMALLERRGRVRRRMGDMAGAARDFATSAAIAREEGRIDRQVEALLDQAGALFWVDREQGLRAADEAVALSRPLGDRPLQAGARGHLAFGRLLARGWRAADAEACVQALTAARQTGDRAFLSLYLGRCAYLQCHRSEYHTACDTAREGLDLALELDEPYHYMSCQFHRGWALLHRGELGKAIDVLADGHQMADRNGHHPWARVFRFATAWVHEQAFDYEGARAMCEQELQPMPSPLLGQFLGLMVLGMAQQGLGQPERALDTFAEVTGRLEGGSILMDWILRMPLHRGLGECRLARGDLAGARREAEQLSALAARPPERGYLALGRQLLAEIALAEGRLDRAESELAQALAALDDLDAPLAGWQVHATAARVLAQRNHPAQARRHRERSAAMVRRLADSLRGWPALQRGLVSEPRVRALIG